MSEANYISSESSEELTNFRKPIKSSAVQPTQPQFEMNRESVQMNIAE